MKPPAVKQQAMTRRMARSWNRAKALGQVDHVETVDHVFRVRLRGQLESMNDSPGAEMRGPPAVYQSGQTQRLEVPQAPGLVAAVERNPAMFRYDRYLPAEVGRASVLRLRAAFEYGN